TITILIRHLEPAISIFEIYSPFLYLRTLIKDSLLRVNRGYQQRNNMCRTKSINLDFVQLRWPDPEGPEGKASRHTGCPATQGWTLGLKMLNSQQHALSRERIGEKIKTVYGLMTPCVIQHRTI
ncbi:hypothetical protein T440DRAFT_525810, partial [Plenodomus tracheiphilus IPT5]